MAGLVSSAQITDFRVNKYLEEIKAIAALYIKVKQNAEPANSCIVKGL